MEQSYSSQQSSNTFNIEHTSQQINLDKHFHTKDIQIIKQGQKRKVIFGQMEQQERSLLEIVSPYMSTAAYVTGNIAYQAGSIAFEYLKQGFWWVYDQITNTIIPYTRQEIPKLFIIISKSARGKDAIKSGQFCVLQMQDQDYMEISKKQKKQKQGPIKVLINLGPKDQALIEQIKRNHDVSYSFPIENLDGQSQRMSITYCIPSQSYEILQKQAKQALNVSRSRAIQIVETIQQVKELNSQPQNKNFKVKQQIKNSQLKPVQVSKVQQKIEQLLNQGLKRNDSQQWQQVNESLIYQKSKPKAIFLPDACCFIYEQGDELYPYLKQKLEADDNIIVGHLVSSQQFKKKQQKNDGDSGEMPLITIDNKIIPSIQMKKQVETKDIKQCQKKIVVDIQKDDVNMKRKVVDTQRKVRLQVGYKDNEFNKDINGRQQKQIKEKQRQMMLN